MRIWKDSVLAYIGGMAYVGIELLWRGWSHPSMFVVGGLCFLLIGGINQGILRWEMPMELQIVLGACIVTVLELVSGLILNRWLGLGIWDYSAYPLNFMGQICLEYFLFWNVLSFVAILADDWLRHVLFGEKRPAYTWLLRPHPRFRTHP
jgi:uncharacterized membrane protein